jgi:hypothetical protein
VLPRGVGAASAIGGLGALAVVLVYGLIAVTTGLLAIAGATGYLGGLALRGAQGAAGRAVAIGAIAMLIGILGGWAVSLAEGGIAGPVDYIGQTLGPLAIVVPAVAAVAAWLGSR